MRARALILLPAISAIALFGATNPRSFAVGGHTNYGNWTGDIRYSPSAWKPGDAINVEATLKLQGRHLQSLAADLKIQPDNFILLVTAERIFDAAGRLRFPSDQTMSTLITPTGLPIEGGVQGALTTRFGGPFKTPFDQLVSAPVKPLAPMPDGRILFHASGQMPADLPPGIYRLRLDYGIAQGTRYYTLNGDTFASRPTFRGIEPQSYVYSPPIPASGVNATGDAVDAGAIQPRIPWVLLRNYNSNGYQGVIADEDQPYFALSTRILIQDDVILPRFDANNKPIAYSLEPQFSADTIDDCWNIPWNYASGETAVEVTGPDGNTVSLGKWPFLKQSGYGPSTGKSNLTAWVPPAYGQYTVKETGWIRDTWGNRYEGGGTYRFWIAKRMTLATATFQGMPYPVGSTYGRDIAFAPPAPADVTVTATLYPDSDPARAQTMSWGGKATVSGVFGALQGSRSMPLSAPGEYAAHILATYTDKDGHLWVSTMRHAGVVYDPKGPIVARGKKLAINGSYADRGNTFDEGYIVSATDTEHLVHLNFPYNSGDVLLMAADQQGANKMIPTLTYETKLNPQRDDAVLNGIGISNIQLKTSNGYSPHMFPEYITEWNYYYGSAARPGFVGRFLVGETSVRTPYWSLSPNTFGGQINASSNGDSPGDIYRLMGGVVLRASGKPPMYAGYVSSAFLLPRGTNNNRVIQPGTEELIGSTGQKSRVFLVGPRPGMTYPVGSTFTAAFQIDPIVPVNITVKMTYPDGRIAQTSGTSDQYGSFAGPDRFVLDTPGIYTYSVDASWNGYKPFMPGLPSSGGEIYVLESNPPANAKGIEIMVPDGTTFDPAAGIHIIGKSSADKVRYTVVMPGAVLDQGSLTVTNGQFDYLLNPADLHNRAQTYDTHEIATGKPALGDVLHVTLFSEEKTADGQSFHAFARVVVRGNQVRIAP